MDSDDSFNPVDHDLNMDPASASHDNPSTNFDSISTNYEDPSIHTGPSSSQPSVINSRGHLRCVNCTLNVTRIRRHLLEIAEVRNVDGFSRIRIITFGLACILCYAVCFGLTLAMVVGIAYGYNYSMAEFMTFTRSDVTVFMRRGQFYDKRSALLRRSGDSEDMFATNASTDYEDQKPPEESQPLADTWLKTQDTRKYAEVLTRYKPAKKAEVLESETKVPRTDRVTLIQVPSREYNLKPTLNAPIISTVPNPLMPTVTWRSGSSKIIMRNFEPLTETLFPTRSTGPQSMSSHKEQPKENVHDDADDSYAPMRVWGRTTVRARIPDEPDDVDEDNIVYKPV